MTTVCTTGLGVAAFSSDFSVDLLSLLAAEEAVSVVDVAVEDVVVPEMLLPKELLPEDELALLEVLLSVEGVKDVEEGVVVGLTV